MEKLCIFGALLSAVVLVGCDRDVHVTTTNPTNEGAGGAGGADGADNDDDDDDDTSEPKTTTETSARNSNVIYGQLLDFETDDEDDKINAVLSSTDPSLAKEILNGAITWEIPKPNRPESSKTSYTIERNGTDKIGRIVEIKTHGDTLTETGEFVAIHEIVTGLDTGLQSAGTPVSELPEGTFLYSGTAIIRKGSDKDMQGKGTFQMKADFQKNEVRIDAVTSADADNNIAGMYFSADKMKIVPSTGAFSTDSATIGLSNGATESASISGYFAGTDAEGVHGLAYSNDTQNYTGAFYGKKSQ